VYTLLSTIIGIFLTGYRKLDEKCNRYKLRSKVYKINFTGIEDQMFI